jgi:hypothetical protein
MYKSKSAPGALQSVMSNPFAFSDVGARAQAFWKAQGDVAQHVQQYADEWCERRRAAAVAAADCCASLFSGGDLSATPKAWSNWVTGSLERLRADVQEQAALTTRLASVVGDALALGAKATKAAPVGSVKPEPAPTRARAA